MAGTPEQFGIRFEVRGRIIVDPEEFKRLTPAEAFIAFSIQEEKYRLESISLGEGLDFTRRGGLEDFIEQSRLLSAMYFKIVPEHERKELQAEAVQARIDYLNRELQHKYSPFVNESVSKRMHALQKILDDLQGS